MQTLFAKQSTYTLICNKAKGRLEVYLNLRIRKPAVIFETICLKGMTIAWMFELCFKVVPNMSRKEVGLPTEYILFVKMITVTVFYRITRKTILSKGRFLHRSRDHEKCEVNGVEVEAGEPLLLTIERNMEHLTMEGFNVWVSQSYL